MQSILSDSNSLLSLCHHAMFPSTAIDHLLQNRYSISKEGMRRTSYAKLLLTYHGEVYLIEVNPSIVLI